MNVDIILGMQKITRLISLCCLAILSAFVICSIPDAQSNQPAIRDQNAQPSSLVQSDCATSVLDSLAADCWLLRVAEDRSDHHSAFIELPIGVIHSQSETKRQPADPVLYFAGGTAYSILNNKEFIEHYLTEVAPRTLIVWDMRGFTHSNPSLHCPGLDKPMKMLGQFAGYPAVSDAPIRQRVEAAGAQFAACLKKLRGEGIHPEFYNEYEIARDAADLMALLGYKEFNVYGHSAGGSHIFNFIRHFSDRVRSAVYDAPWLIPARDTAEINIIHQAYDQAVALLDTCVREEPGCQKIMPNPSISLMNARAQLDRDPFKTTVTRPDGTKETLTFDGSKLFGPFYGALNYIYSRLPSVLAQVAQGDYSLLPEHFGLEFTSVYKAPSKEWALGAMAALECADKSQDRMSKDAVIDMYEREPAMLYGFDTSAFCAWWDASSSAPKDHRQWFKHQTPSLALVGEADPCCGRPYAEKLAKFNPHVVIAEFAGRGHWPPSRALDSNGFPCQAQIVKTFLDDPTQQPDLSCLEGYKRTWVLPQTPSVKIGN